MEGGQLLIFVLVAALVIGLAIWGYFREKKRREAFVALAARLGLRFSSRKDRTCALRLGFLDRLARGSNRYAYNVLRGRYEGEEILAFDYHYETHSRDSKGRRRTSHHHLSCFALFLPATFPELTIGPEGLFSKIAQAVGYDDIDFESHEFSKNFCVRSKDKKFAYDFCHGRMMEYLLQHPDISLEVELDALALVYGRRLSVGEIEANLRRLVEIRRLMPEYLFAAR